MRRGGGGVYFFIIQNIIFYKCNILYVQYPPEGACEEVEGGKEREEELGDAEEGRAEVELILEDAGQIYYIILYYIILYYMMI